MTGLTQTPATSAVLIAAAEVTRNRLIDRNTVQFRHTETTDDVLIDAADIIQNLTDALKRADEAFAAERADKLVIHSKGADFHARAIVAERKVTELSEAITTVKSVLSNSLLPIAKKTAQAKAVLMRLDIAGLHTNHEGTA